MHSESIGWIGCWYAYQGCVNGIFTTAHNYDEYNETGGSDALEPTHVDMMIPLTSFLYIPTRPVGLW